MFGYVMRRLLATVPVVLVVTIIVFSLIHMAPGDPLTLLLSEDANETTIKLAREKWGLDQPIYVQYLNYLSILVHGDLGMSFKYGNSKPNTCCAPRKALWSALASSKA